ncbi:HTH domain-containing protein (plasmid) [Halorientalis pallida]|uniref:HTH domain-containing protein n=1 Tax=Halorientalis pallida TaxID=2479928 RepID=UPI003C6F370E
MASKSPRIELFCRSLAPSTGRDYQERTLRRLRSLDERDRIRGFEVVLCGDCVCPRSAMAETNPGAQLLDRYESFQTWADENGRELVGFERRNTESLLTGTTVTGIVFPRVTMAEYREGELTFVAPSSNGSEQMSIADRLEEYEWEDVGSRSDEAQREPRAEDAAVDQVEDEE